jgi:hypothetical protein
LRLRPGLAIAMARAMAIALVCSMPAARSQTLGELINQVKKAREAELLGAPAPSKSAKPGPRVSAAHDALPLVWSISGLDEQFSAVLVHDSKVHVVASGDLPLRLGPWQLVSVGHGGVMVRRWLGVPSRPDVVLIKAPAPGAALDAYLKQLQPRSAQASAMADSPAALPADVPMSARLALVPTAPVVSPSAQAHAARLPVKRNELSPPGAAPAQPSE